MICKVKSDPCHIKSVGSGGGDEDWNIINLCRMHHTFQHSFGWFRFCEKFPVVARELDKRGWVFDLNRKLVRK